MILHPLFHWAPVGRRKAITRRGLLPGSRPDREGSEPMPYVCAAPSPSMAWALSASVLGERGTEWDLWQVSLDPDDEVSVREFWGNRPEEIRVHNRIPKSRLWLVGTRSVPAKGRRW